MNNAQEILEQLRRDMIDSVSERIKEHGLRIIRSDVGEHPKYGKQLIIIIQAEEDKNDDG